MKISKILTSTLLASAIMWAPNGYAEKAKVGITGSISSVSVMHNGKKMSIMRNQNQKNIINPAFAKTSRKCPPFCIQPIKLAPGVETLGEVEVINYLDRLHNKGDTSIQVVDSRTPDWVKRGTIPGSISVPWTKLNPAKGADPIGMHEVVTTHFGVTGDDLDSLNFSNAKTLVMFCNGMWCGQSPNNIKNLLKMGYPAEKIKWYRGGMQDWEVLGLATAK